MRNFFKVIVFCSVLFAGSLSAQTLKFGHIDFQALLQLMPEREVAKSALEKVQADLESKLGLMQKEYSEKAVKIFSNYYQNTEITSLMNSPKP